MAKLSEQVNDKDIAENASELFGGDTPSVIVGVQRKANIGRYENIDVYCAIKLPLGVNYADLTADFESAIQYGFAITSSETLKRYNKISVYGTEAAVQEDQTPQ